MPCDRFTVTTSPAASGRLGVNRAVWLAFVKE
jgi:hypothetical protein